MKRLSFTVAMLIVAATLGAQTTPTPVHTPITTIARLTPGDDRYNGGLAGAPGAKLIYYTTEGAIQVYNRVTKTTSVVAKGSYGNIATSSRGDWLLATRSAEDPKVGAKQPEYLWTLSVNPTTGIPTGEPRRVSTLPADAPAFSHDGKWIAFIATGNPRRMMVIPSSGGAERVLFERGMPRGPVQWSQDGKWIYFSQPSGDKQMPEVVSRVSIDGGTPSPVTPPERGGMLAPDGDHVVGIVAGGFRGLTLGIFDEAKTMVGSTALDMPAGGELCDFGWSGSGLRMIAALCGADIAQHSRNIATGVDHVLPLGGPVARVPSISPDGRRVAMAIPADTSAWLVAITNADGTNRRIVQPLDAWDMTQAVWSPDSRYIAYMADKKGTSLNIADAATATVAKAIPGQSHVGDWRWRSDSRTFMYIRNDSVQANAKAAVHEASIGGSDRVLRDLTPELPTKGDKYEAVTWFLGDSAVLVIRLGLVIPIYGGPSYHIYDSLKVTNETAPAISMDGRQVAVPDAADKSIELITVDGRSRRTVKFPDSAPISAAMVFLADNRTIAVGVRSTPTSPAAIYLIPADGGAPRPFVKLAKGEEVRDLSMSQDGKTLLYGVASPLSITFIEADLGAGLKPTSTKKPE